MQVKAGIIRHENRLSLHPQAIWDHQSACDASDPVFRRILFAFQAGLPLRAGTPTPALGEFYVHSGRQDLNLRPLDPQSSALAMLRHAP